MNFVLLENSLLVSAFTTVFAVALGFMAALWLAGLSKTWRMPILTVTIIGLALPPFLVTNCWLDLLGAAGSWRRWAPLNIMSLGGAVWILTLLLWPITVLIVLGAWERLEPAQLESDMALRGSALIRTLLLPLARNSLTQAAVLTFVLALNNFAVPSILQVKVFPAEIWVRFSANLDVAGALILTLPLVIAPLLLLAWLSRREFSWPRLEGPAATALVRRQLGRPWFWFCGACTLFLGLFSVGVPLLQIAGVKRTWTELPGAVAAGQRAIWNSFFCAAATTLLVTAIALLLGNRRAQAFRSPSWVLRRNPLGIFWLPFLAPGILTGLLLIAVLNRSFLAPFYQSIGIVILAFLIRYFVLGWYSVTNALQTVDPDLIADARLNGASRWQMLCWVHWPQISSQIAAAGYVIFLLCLWDVESMILVVPPGGETLALRIFNLLHYGHNAQVNALCLTLLGVAVAPLLVWKLINLLRVPYSVTSKTASRNTEYGIRNTSAGLFLVSVLLFLTGCKPTSTNTPLASKLFGHVQIVGSRGVGVGELNKPRSVAVDSQENLYVVDMTGRVQKFSPRGDFLLSWQMPQTDLGKPKGMCHDREGNILVVEPHYQRVNLFSPVGKLITQWGEKGTNFGQFMLPRSVAVNSHGEIYVSEYGAVERVQRFGFTDKPEGRARLSSARHDPPEKPGALGTDSPHLDEEQPPPVFLDSFGHPGTGPGEFNRPEGLCIDAQDNVHVADSCNHRVQIFSREGKFIRSFGKAGTKKGELSYPYDICVDAAGRQYVCEFGNSRIQVFDANDQPLEIIGGTGAAPGQFSNPWGMALDSGGNLYVADSQNHRVQKLVRGESVSREGSSRTPKSEGNPSFEPRNDQTAILFCQFTHSDFELLSDFGFRPSDFWAELAYKRR